MEKRLFNGLNSRVWNPLFTSENLTKCHVATA